MPNEGYVCQKCWVQVSVFHEFYICIESKHGAGHAIFIECRLDPDGVKHASDELKGESTHSENIVVTDVSLKCEGSNGMNGPPESDDDDGGDDYNDNFFNDAPDEKIKDVASATAAKTAMKPPTNKTRRKTPGGYKRKYDRRIRHDYSSFQ